jgi:hypothetical protein
MINKIGCFFNIHKPTKLKMVYISYKLATDIYKVCECGKHKEFIRTNLAKITR